ncbi:zinc-dependent metalloprotease [Aquimarina agarilytica]|uniref:zinc-dependent metalloprotease n=1 Tax=Aquimarina agarilytica TaxID=1087449 RepID=UPI0002892562|nr:zinc-dependent metalloprotease [Aquimarina agarilytica]
MKQNCNYTLKYTAYGIILLSGLTLNAQSIHQNFTKTGQQNLPSTKKTCALIHKNHKNLLSSNSIPKTINEKEIAGANSNNIKANAEFIPNFGTNSHQQSHITINGKTNSKDPKVIELNEKEDPKKGNDSFDTATILSSENRNTFFEITAEIGDGPHGINGTKKGDFDTYKFSAKKDQNVNLFFASIDIKSELFLTTIVLNSKNELVADGQDINGTGKSLSFTSENDEEYRILIFDTDTGVKDGRITFNLDLKPEDRLGLSTQDKYEIFVGISDTDIDYYTLNLEKGDIFDLRVFNGTTINAELFLPDNSLAINNNTIGSPTDFAIDEEKLSTIPSIGLSYTAPISGLYTIKLAHTGAAEKYEAVLTTSKAGYLTKNIGKRQLFYIDFTGETIGSLNFKSTKFTPLNAELEEKAITLDKIDDYFENWEIENTSKNRTNLTYKIVEGIKNNFKKLEGLNKDYEIYFISDYGNPLLGKYIPKLLHKYNIPHSTLFIGGDNTVDPEIGSGVLGVANSVDIGNFDINDNAIVFLNEISEKIKPDATEFEILDSASYNKIKLADGASKEDLIATGVSYLASHEIGHIVGLEHTDPDNETRTIMDSNSFAHVSLGLENADTPFSKETSKGLIFKADTYASNEILGGENLTDFFAAVNLGYKSKYGFKGIDDTNTTFDNEIKQLEDNVLAVLNDTTEDFETITNKWPNPLPYNQSSILELPQLSNEKTSITIFNLDGKRIADITKLNSIIEENNSLSFTPADYHLNTGTYICKISTDTTTFNRKIVIE